MPEIASWPIEKQIGLNTIKDHIASDPMPRIMVFKVKVINKTVKLPKDVMVGTLPDDRLQLKKSLTVKIEKEGDKYIASCNDFYEFGYGDYLFNAVDDLRMAVVELYWRLNEEKNNLGKDLAKLWENLQQFIEKR